MRVAQPSQNGKACMRCTIVTETYPPEVNGVALTVQGLENGLRARGHEVGHVAHRALLHDFPRVHVRNGVAHFDA